MFTNEDLLNHTFHILLPGDQLEHVVQSWSMVANDRPAIQLRDRKGQQDTYMKQFVLSVRPTDLRQVAFVRHIMTIKGARVHEE